MSAGPLSRIAAIVLIPLLAGACASGFVRSRAPLTWTVEELRREIDTVTGEVR